MLSELSRRHQVTLVTTSGPGDDPAGLERELPRCERVVSVPYAAPKRGTARFALSLANSWLLGQPLDLWRWRVRAVRRQTAQMLAEGGFDVVVADFLAAVPNVPLDVDAPVVLFEHNVEYLIWKRLSDIEDRWWRRVPLEVEWRRLRRWEGRACEQTALTVTVSDNDRHRLATLAPAARIVDVPTGVDITYFQPGRQPEVPGRLVFSGSMDWYPNEDAVLYFAEAVLPQIRRARPDVSLTVVGRRPSAKLRAAADEAGIDVTGTVDDVRPYVWDASLYIVPLRVGGGTRLKIFEALAMGKAVLSTTVGAEGLDVVPGQHLVLADGPDALCQEALALLGDPDRRRALGEAGRRLMEERYSWASVTAAFDRHLHDAVRQVQTDRGAAEPQPVEEV
jgi:glycosyltransferase involved in cell wall biosynthesis